MLAYAALITGVGLGSMYGLLALGFHVTYAVSNTVNFAQGSTMMLGAVLCFTFWVTFGWPLALAIPASLLLCAVWSVVVERVAVRPFVRSGSNSWLMATVALGIVIENVVLFTFGKDPRGMPAGYLTTTYVPVGGIKVQALQLIIPVIGLAAGSRHPPVLPAHALRQGAARRGAEPRRRAPDGDRHRARRDGGIRAVGLPRGRCRHSGRAAVHGLLHDGDAVRHQGVRGRDPWRHRQRLGRGGWPG